MKKSIAIFLICMAAIATCPAQQYGWVDLTANLPDTNLYGGLGKTVFIGNQGWITQAWYTLPRRIFYTSDGGQTFTTQYLPDNAGRIGEIFMRNDSDGYIVTNWDSLNNTGNIFYTTDAQNGNWALLNNISGAGLYCIDFPPEPNPVGYIGSSSGEIYKIEGNAVSYDGWCHTSNDVMGIVFPVNSDEGWAVAGLNIEHRDATGWKIDQNFSTAGVTSIWFADNFNGWVCGDEENILRTTDGHNWVVQHSNGNGRTLYGIDFFDLQNGWAIGNGMIYHTTNGGNQWVSESEQLNLEDIELFDVSVTDATTAYAVGERRSTLHPVFLKFMANVGVTEKSGVMFEVYPNPVRNKLSVRILQSAAGKIELVDLFGKIVMVLFEGELRSDKIEFNVSQLPSGMYFIKITSYNFTITKKIIKMN